MTDKQRAEALLAFPQLNTGEAAALQEKLWELLSRRAALYTGGASTSPPQETARELLLGIYFLLDLTPETTTARLRRLLETDLARRLEFGVMVTESKLRLAQRRWAAACAKAPQTSCRALRDTLAELGALPRRYDVRFFPHQIPCLIDYQLVFPVPEALAGIDYINEYLRRLQLENELLSHFSPGALRGLCCRVASDPNEGVMGLYEPVAACALGLALTGQSPEALAVAPPPRTALNQLLAPLPDAVLRDALGQAADRLSRHFSLSAEAAAALRRFALSLAPRLRAAWPDEADGVFWNWPRNS